MVIPPQAGLTVKVLSPDKTGMGEADGVYGPAGNSPLYVKEMGSGLTYCTVAKSDRGLPANTVDITLPENISQYKLEAIIEKLTGEDFSV